MISADVVEELYGAGWIRDDVQDLEENGKLVQEELWRRGNIVEQRRVGKTVKVLSGENECLQSMFVRFEELEGTHIVIRESARLRIYTVKGEEHFIPLPIALKRMWRSNFGLLLESDLSKKEHFLDDPTIPTPKLLALHHPLDDFTRAVTKQANKSHLQEWQNDQNGILMVSANPSLVITYDSETRLHSAWTLRKCCEDDLNLPQDIIGTPMMRHSMSFRNNDVSRMTPLFNMSRMSSQQQTPEQSKSILSSFDLKSGRPSPTTAGNSPRHQSFARMCRSPSLSQTDLKSRFLSMLSFNGTQDITRNPEEPLPPDISLCLDHLWTEPMLKTPRHQVASKVFLSKDLIGQSYLCFLVGSSLINVQYEINSLQLIFGAAKTIQDVKDVSPCPSLGMMIVLDQMHRKLSLYSGNLRVCGVHFSYSPSVQLAHIAQEIATLHIDSNPQSNVITSSRPPSAVDPNFFHDTSMVLLSPVTGQSKDNSALSSPVKISLKCVHEVMAETALLEYTNGVFVRLALPPIHTSSLIGRCLSALQSSLKSQEACHGLFLEWYCIRNSPGPSSISNAQEWNMFAKCLMQLMGYQTDFINFAAEEFQASRENSMTSPRSSKKMRHSDDGCDGDWQKLLTSKRHHESGKQLSFILGIEDIAPDSTCSKNMDASGQMHRVDTSAPLFSSIRNVLLTLHLLYEDSKLNKFHWKGCPTLASFLSRLAADLDLQKFVSHYWRDFPTVCHMDLEHAKTYQITRDIKIPDTIDDDPPSIFQTFHAILAQKWPLKPFPIVGEVTSRTQDLIIVFAIFSSQGGLIEPEKFCQSSKPLKAIEADPKLGNAGRIVEYIVKRGFNTWTVQSIPIGFAIPMLASIYECRMSPPLISWSAEVFELIGRPELIGDKMTIKRTNVDKADLKNLINNPTTSDGSETVEDGLEDIETDITRLRWPNDRRVSDVRKLLQSARPVIIGVQQRPEVSDHDFVEEQERSLQSLCIRTMALPVGRGAISFQTAVPLPTEPISIPRLCLSGKAPPRGTTVEMDHIDVVPHMDRWPSFHNGVAAGLRVPSDLGSIDSNWITFNKPREGHHPNDLVEHGGLLMALGLNGHLAKLGKLESFDYLIRGNEMISIGLLLGMSAAKRGTMDLLATKKISTQLEALLPPTATELPLSHTTQVAGLVGLGLLYQGTGHRHMAEVCLGELGRPPGPEMENCTDRESYSLAAGLALGMITLGQGESLNEGALSDLNLAESLYYHMVGGPRPDNLNRNKFRSPSYQVQEGDCINIDVTSPGATLALGLMFFRSGNERVASWLEAPESRFLLEFVRPDFLMLRTLAKGLILWDRIEPTSEWIQSHVPKSMQPHCLVRPAENANGIDYETINQAYCNLIAGAALAMGLRFAGTANNEAFQSLFALTKKLMAISKRSVAELAGKATMEQTICIMVLSLSIVMAGTGDLDVIRLVRFLRSRVGPIKHSTVTYGSHMALHMALGLLFLGGGRYTLNTRPESVAAMVAAFFPKFPTHSNDNRYHLQALRHLYVLAAEPRLLTPCDVKTGELVFTHLNLEFCDTMWYEGFSLQLMAPCILPELHLLKRVSIDDERYHNISFDSLEALNKLLSENQGILYVKQKAGCLSYKNDPKGHLSLTAQVLTQDTSFHWSLTASSSLLLSFSSEPGVSCFSQSFVKQEQGGSGDCSKYEEVMGSLLYECASHEKLDLLSFWISTFQLQWQINRPGNCFVGAQLSLIVTMSKLKEQNLICPEIIASIMQSLRAKADRQRQQRRKLVHNDVRDLIVSNEDVFLTNSLFNFEGLNNLGQGLQSNPLLLMKSQAKLNGHSAHALREFA